MQKKKYSLRQPKIRLETRAKFAEWEVIKALTSQLIEDLTASRKALEASCKHEVVLQIKDFSKSFDPDDMDTPGERICLNCGLSETFFQRHSYGRPTSEYYYHWLTGEAHPLKLPIYHLRWGGRAAEQQEYAALFNPLNFSTAQIRKTIEKGIKNDKVWEQTNAEQQ